MRGRENLLDFRDRDRVDRSASTPADSSQEMNGRHSGGLNVLWANLSGAHIYREANQESVHAAAMGLRYHPSNQLQVPSRHIGH